ncbi:hypothetical protein OAV04_01510, partial [Candidatus Poseidoniaceae archaeon]|nr:hypothetical protein [Candidatus Poseidoniaceae archaeon]
MRVLWFLDLTYVAFPNNSRNPLMRLAEWLKALMAPLDLKRMVGPIALTGRKRLGLIRTLE